MRGSSGVEGLGGAEGEQWAAAFAKVLEESKVECGPAHEGAAAFAEGLGGAEGQEVQAVALLRLREACL